MRVFAVLVAAVLLAVSIPAVAQSAAQQPFIAEGETVAAALDRWFDVLTTATDAGDGDIAAGNIERLWMISGSPTADLLIRRATDAMNDGHYEIALDILDGVIVMRPDFAEAWNKRATIYYLLGDYANSVADCEHVVALEPRHFGALSGLGQIFYSLGQDGRALIAFHEALKYNPFLTGAAAIAAGLEAELGEDI